MSNIRKQFVPLLTDHEQDKKLFFYQQKIIAIAENIEEDLLSSRERSIALTKLEEAAMWINKAIALDGYRETDE